MRQRPDPRRIPRWWARPRGAGPPEGDGVSLPRAAVSPPEGDGVSPEGGGRLLRALPSGVAEVVRLGAGGARFTPIEVITW
jgi:hypothetical protein